MAEEYKKPPLQEIPSRPLQKIPDGDADLVNLVNSIKESLNVKMHALRKDLDLTIHDQISNEMSSVQAKIQELVERFRTEIQGESRQQTSGTLDELKQMQEKLNGKHVELAEANISLSKQLSSLSGRVEEMAGIAANAVPASEIKHLRQEVATNLEKTQALVSKFDLPLFMNDIRDAFSVKVVQAEARAGKLANDLEITSKEKEQLQKDLAETRARLGTVLEENERLQKDLVETKGRLTEEISRITALLQQKSAEIRELHASRMPRQERATSPVKDTTGVEPPSVHPVLADAAQKTARFCYNCGKPRTGTSARFCTFCGEGFSN